MKRSTIVNLLLAAIAAIMVSACGNSSSAPSTDFASYVKAYTGGVISEGSTIKVAINSNVPEGASAEGLFSFSPEIKGSARWLNNSMAEFVPDQGELKPGQKYTGYFSLDKVMKVADSKLSKFPLKFVVAQKEANIAIDNVILNAADPEKVTIEGTVNTSQPAEEAAIKAMITSDGYLEVTPDADSKTWKFTISDIQREDKDKKITIHFKEGRTGFKVRNEVVHTTIPGKNADFGVMTVKHIESKTPYININFTQPLSDMDLKGIVGLSGVENYTIAAENNVIKLYYDNNYSDNMTLSIVQDIKSCDGDRLSAPFTMDIAGSQDKPSVKIPIKGNILPDGKSLVLPFKAVNLNAVDLRVVKIFEDNVLMFLQDNNIDGSAELRRAGRLVYSECIRLDGDTSKDLHRWNDFSVDISNLFKKEPGAIYRISLTFNKDYSIYGKDFISENMVDMSAGMMNEEDELIWDVPSTYYYDNINWDKVKWSDRNNPDTDSYYAYYNYPSINLTASNIGLIAKYADGDKIWVTSTDIMEAKPLSGVEFKVYNFQLREIGKGRSNGDGLAEISLKGKPFAVVAKKGDNTSYLKITTDNVKSLSRFDVGGVKTEKGLKAYIYGERGVWRPGDTLHVTMILRDKEKKIPDTHPAVMELYTPEGQFYTKLIANATDGFYSVNIPTLADDPTGIWNAYFKVGGATFHKSLRVETIKPNRLKVNIDFGENQLQGGKKTPVTVTSNWLTGPAAAGLQTKAYMTLSKGGQKIQGFDGYIFNNPLSSFTSSDHDFLDTRLDGQGASNTTVTMPTAADAPGLMTANVVCSVLEEGGDASYTTVTMPFSPFEAYVGVKVPKTDEGYLEVEKDNSVSVALVDMNGKRMSGHNLNYSIYKLDWSWWWESKASELDSYVNSSSAKPFATGDFVSGQSDNVITFNVPKDEWGRYLVYVKDKDGGHASGTIVTVDWPSYWGRSDRKDPNALTMLTFTTDKTSYEAGETATLYVPAAKGGKALVSFENASGVISQDWVSTREDGDTKYNFKVTPEMTPNFYIHITLLQPHGNTANDLPIRMYGVQPIGVNNKASHLEPVITMADNIHPEERFTVKVSEKNGKPMTYTLAIVDDGLLDLTGFKTPDPWSEMYAREALGVNTWDLFDDVIGAFSGRFSPMFSVGGDESVIIANKKDNRFNPVVKFLGPFTLGRGSATHEITLPMYVGSVRVMVVAGKDGAFGSADKTVKVTSPLMVLPTLPRVISVGEKVTLPVNVFALEDGVKNANVSVKVDGPVKISGPSQTSVSFDKPGDKLVTFALETTGEGTAHVTVSANGNGQKASDTIDIEVRNPNPTITKIQKAILNSGETVGFEFAPFAMDDKNWASLELASFPSINFDANFSYFKNYEYSCTEQLASYGISLVNTKDFLSEENAAQVDEIVAKLLQELYSRQLADGGFAYWPGNTSADTWVTSMAGQFLNEAAKKGYNVSSGVIGNWAKFQNNSVRNYRHSSSKWLNDLDQAYRLYTLSLAGKADNASMNRLKESQGLSEQARWMLASAYALGGKTSIAKDLVSNVGSEFKDYSAANITFGSSLRDKAIATETLTLTAQIPEAMEMAEKIAGEFTDGWASTQERAFASTALSRLAAKVGTGDIKAEVSPGSNVESKKSSVSERVNPSSGNVSVKNLSSGSLYATLVTVSKAAANQTIPAAASGIKIKVSYQGTDGSELNPASIRQGTDFNVVITVTNTSLAEDYTNMALTEMIPSGWEIYNDRMMGTVSSQNSYNYHDIRDDRNIWYFDLARGTSKTFKSRMRAAYEGEFVLPAVTCENMYNAKVSANTASGKAVVTK